MLVTLSGCADGPPAAADRAVVQPVRVDVTASEPSPAAGIDLPSVSSDVEVPRSAATLEPVERAEPPVRVVVESVDIDAEIIPVGVEDDGQMELPANPDTLGWYRYGPSVPAEAGSTVIAGHVDSRRFGVGPLAALQRVETGASVVVTTSTGEEVFYRVVDVQSIAKRNVPLDEYFAREGEPRLVMITCGGDFDQDSRSYSDNVVVTAVPS